MKVMIKNVALKSRARLTSRRHANRFRNASIKLWSQHHRMWFPWFEHGSSQGVHLLPAEEENSTISNDTVGESDVTATSNHIERSRWRYGNRLLSHRLHCPNVFLPLWDEAVGLIALFHLKIGILDSLSLGLFNRMCIGRTRADLKICVLSSHPL